MEVKNFVAYCRLPSPAPRRGGGEVEERGRRGEGEVEERWRRGRGEVEER